MISRKIFVVTVCATVGFSAMAENQYSYDMTNPKIYIVTTPAGETNEISEAAVGVLNGGGVTNFIKRGGGVFVSNKDISSYEGGIEIEEGIFRSIASTAANRTVGKLSGGGDIWVRDGATLEAGTATPDLYSCHMYGKTIHIKGRGVGDQGALSVIPGTADGFSFGITNSLYGNALICNHGCQGFKITGKSGAIDFNGYTLHVGGTTWSKDGDALVRIIGGTPLLDLPATGAAIVSEGYGVEFFSASSSNVWNLWHVGRELVVTNTSRLMMRGMFSNNFKWDVKLHEGSLIQVSDTGSQWTFSTSYNYLSPGSNMSLLDPVRNTMQLTHKMDHLYIKGKISGGGLIVKTYTPGTCGLYLSNPDNKFTNGAVVVNCSIHMITNGALPASGAPLMLTNSAAAFRSSENYSLPPLEAYGNCIVSNHNAFSATGSWRDYVRKTGSGILEYRTLIGSPLLDVQNGTVKLTGVGGSLPVFEGVCGASDGTLDLEGENYSVENMSGSVNVANCPSFTVTDRWEFDANTSKDAAGASIGGNLVFADGSVISVTDPEVIPAGGRSRRWTLVSAEGGISGLPAIECHVKGWAVEKSADGKTLYLDSPRVGFMMIVK